MASSDNAKEFVKKRLRPALQNCNILAQQMPVNRKEDSNALIQFQSMNLIIRGSNSRIGLQSDPVKTIICDERREWKPGAIDLLRKRTRTFFDAIEIGVGTAGTEFDELHMDYLEGSQGMFFWSCLKCDHQQTFRFGKHPTSYYPEARQKGGFIWETSEETKPGGSWDYDKVKKTVRYECEHCGHLYKNSDKPKLVETIELIHQNPDALPKYVSMHWWAAYMPWGDCEWGEIVVEFLKANHAKKLGNIEPLKTFVTETLGEPWRPPTLDDQRSRIDQAVGKFQMGHRFDGGGISAPVITVDVQHGYLVYVIREWKMNYGSRMLECGKLLDAQELSAKQREFGIRPEGVWVDSGYRTADVLAWCVQYGWYPMLGDDAKEFTQIRENPKTLKMEGMRVFWKMTEVDPGMGKPEQGRMTVPRYSWSNHHYKDQLYLYNIPQMLGIWEIPTDAPPDYLHQMSVTERIEIVDLKGVVSYEWKERGRHDFADCELMQLVVSDIGNVMGGGVT
jgi:hypothetical protein